MTTHDSDAQTDQPSGEATLIFPSEVGTTIDHWVKFSSFKYSRANRNAGPEQGPFLSSIVLPCPAQVATSYTANYENTALGFMGNKLAEVGAAGGDAMRKIISQQAMSSSDISSIKEKLMFGNKNITREMIGAAVAQGLDTFPGLSVGTGLTRNPHQAVLYQGTEFREHPFNFRLIPRDVGESETLFAIIKTFKLAMHPEFLAGSENTLFEYPDEWEITFHFEHGMFDIGPSVLTKFDVTYGPSSGSPSVFRGSKMPTEINISLAFRETTIITKPLVEANR